MKIIFVYASAGAGHFKAAQALYNYFKQRNPEASLELVDVLDKTNGFFRYLYSQGYSFLVNQAPFLWAVAFKSTNCRFLAPLARPVFSLVNRMSTGGFSAYLIREKADIIISTHFLTSEMAAGLKSSGKISSKVVTVVTDFGVHAFWVNPGTDNYITASEFGRKQLVSGGVDDAKISKLGIPVDPKFLKEFDKFFLREKFGIPRDRFTVLVATGSFGTGPIEKIIEALRPEVNFIVVCARNKKLEERLKTKKYENCAVFGFVDNIQELMSASDVIITKPGGLSIAELLVMNLFPVFIVPIPGQETGNIKALAECGIGVYPQGIAGIRKIILELKASPEKLEKEKLKIAGLRKPQACEEIYNAVCQSSPGPSP